MAQPGSFNKAPPPDNLSAEGKFFQIDELKCAQCPLHDTSFSRDVRRSGVYGKGTGANGLMVIGEALGAQEVYDGLPFVGRAGNLLSETFQKLGIIEQHCYITNTARCRPPGNRAPTAEEQRLCMAAHAEKDLPPQDPPKFILLLGAVALKAVLGLQKITERRGIWVDSTYFGHPVKVLPTFHPANILRKPELYPTFEGDIRLVKNAVYNIRAPEGPEIHREMINSRERYLGWMNFLADFDGPIASDIETTGLKFYEDEICSIAYAIEQGGKYYGIAFLVKFSRLTEEQNKWWMADFDDSEIYEAHRKVTDRELGIDYHNSGFDALFKWFRGFNVKIRHDTLDGHLIVDETTPHGLKFLVSNNFAAKAGYQADILEAVGGKAADICKAPPEILLPYNCEDTVSTRRLDHEVLVPRMIEDGMKDFYQNHAMPLKRTLARMKFRGFLVDRERVISKSESYRERVKEKEEELFSTVGKRFKYTSQAQLTAVLFNDLKLPIIKQTDKGAPSTDKETLEELSKRHPVPKMVLGVRHLKKNLSTYLDGWDGDDERPEKPGGILQWLDKNNRCHPDFLTHGTISGRLAAREPSLLNIPRDPDIRMNFMAPFGWKLLDFDYSQAELVLLAYLAQDDDFIQACMTTDLHQTVMDKLLSKSVALKERFAAMTPKDLRNVAKSVNFRKAYRGGPAGLADQLKLSVEETTAWYQEWDSAFPKVPMWWKDKEIEWRTWGYIQGVYGRRKHFPPAFDESTVAYYDRLSANFPCQNGVADTTNRSLFLIDQCFERLFGWTPKKIYEVPGLVLAVHDNIIGEAPDELVDDIRKIMETIMSLPVPGLGVQLKTDFHCVQRWGQDEYEKQLKAEAEKKAAAEKVEQERIIVEEHELKDQAML